MRDLEPDFRVKDFSITGFGTTKRGNSQWSMGFIVGICIPKFQFKIPSKYTLFQKSPSPGFWNCQRHETLFHVSLFSFYPSPFYFFFSSYQTTIQSLPLTVLIFFLLFVLVWLNLFSVFRFQVRSFFLSLIFVFLSYAYPSISHSFSLKIWVLCRLFCFSIPTNFFLPLYSDLSQALFVQCSQPYSDFPGKSNLII